MLLGGYMQGKRGTEHAAYLAYVSSSVTEV